mmetsp:Transcript_16993/g.41405  ORF Transcript_16993/g.41405 Transcript_16993/m.41405 type:complete len:120 (-) Transcript_16993:463-822(-)
MSETTTIPLMTPRQAIFHSADLLLAKNKNKSPDSNATAVSGGKPIIQVQGQVALWDPELDRLDMVHEGAKLIVRTTSCDDKDAFALALKLGNTVVAQGVLKKEQRRTFLEATKVWSSMD